MSIFDNKILAKHEFEPEIVEGDPLAGIIPASGTQFTPAQPKPIDMPTEVGPVNEGLENALAAKARDYIRKKYGLRDPAELAAAQKRDAQNEVLSNAGDHFTRGAALMRNESNVPTVHALESKAAEREEAMRGATKEDFQTISAIQQKEKADAELAKAKDPNSMQNKAARQALAALAPELVAKMDPNVFGSMTQEQLEKALPGAKELLGRQTQLELQKMQGDVAAAHDKNALDLAGINRDSAEKVARGNNATTLEVARMNNATDMAKMSAAERAAKLKEEKELNPGQFFDIMPGKAPTVDDLKKFKDKAVPAYTVAMKADQLGKILERNGGKFPMTGDDAVEARSLAASLVGTYKDAKQLGAISGADMDLIEGEVKLDPTKFSSWMKTSFGLENPVAGLKQLKRNVGTDVVSHANFIGLQPKSGSPFEMKTQTNAPPKSYAPEHVATVGEIMRAHPDWTPAQITAAMNAMARK